MDKEEILKKLSTFSIGPIIGAVINFITTPVITHFISPDEYGKASMFTVALSIIQLVIFLGMDQAYAKRYVETDNKSSLLVNAIVPSAFLITICEIFALFNIESLGKWIFNSNAEKLCVYCLIIILPALAAERFLLLNIRMSQRGKLYSGMTIFFKILILALTVLFFLTFEKSFRSVVCGYTFSQITYAIVLFYIQKNELKINYKWIKLNEINALLKFGLPLVPTTIIGWILTGMDKVMLRSIGTYEQLGLYSVAAKVAAVLTIIQTCFTTFWLPLAYQWNKDNVDKKNFTKVGRILSCSMSIIFVLILIFKNVIFTIFSQSYSEAANIVPFLLFTPIMYTISEVTVVGIYFKEKTVWTILVSALSASINLLLNSILIPILGPIGASIATGVSYIVFFWIRTIISNRIWYHFPMKHFLLVTGILLCSAAVSTFRDGILMYIVDAICVLLLSLLYRNEVIEILSTIISIINLNYSRG